MGLLLLLLLMMWLLLLLMLLLQLLLAGLGVCAWSCICRGRGPRTWVQLPFSLPPQHSPKPAPANVPYAPPPTVSASPKRPRAGAFLGCCDGLYIAIRIR